MPTTPELLDAMTGLDTLMRTENPLKGNWTLDSEATDIGQATSTGWGSRGAGVVTGAKYTGAITGEGSLIYAAIATMNVIPGENTQSFRIGWGTTYTEIERVTSITATVRIRNSATTIAEEFFVPFRNGDRWALLRQGNKVTTWIKDEEEWKEVLSAETKPLSTTKEPFIFIEPKGLPNTNIRITNFAAGALVVAKGQAKISGTGTISGKGFKSTFGRVTVSGTGTVASKITSFYFDKASISGNGSVVAKGVTVKIGKTVIGGTSSISAKAIPIRVGKATISGHGAISSVGAIGAGNLFILYEGSLREVTLLDGLSRRVALTLK